MLIRNRVSDNDAYRVRVTELRSSITGGPVAGIAPTRTNHAIALREAQEGLRAPPMPSNGEVERPRRSAGQAPRAHTVFPRPRSVTTHASRPAPTIVRQHASAPS